MFPRTQTVSLKPGNYPSHEHRVLLWPLPFPVHVDSRRMSNSYHLLCHVPGTLHLLCHLSLNTTLWGTGNGSWRARYSSWNAGSSSSLHPLIKLIGSVLRNAVWKYFLRIYGLYYDLFTSLLENDLRCKTRNEFRIYYNSIKKKKKKD